MNILIDNKDIESYFGITVLDWGNALSFASERENERTWHDKSGVDKNLENIRFDAKEFILKCIVKASNEVAAYNLVNTLVEYMFSKGNFILSFRDTVTGIRECFLCERSTIISPDINIRQQNSLYVFKLSLKDVNPNALKFYKTVAAGQISVSYDKGKYAPIYLGDGRIEEVTNTKIYTYTGYTDTLVDVVIDIDSNDAVVTGVFASFTADVTSGEFPLEVTFTDLSTGTVSIYSWDFGDGNTSSEQNPVHTYESEGVFTVTLQIFNTVNGTDTEEKIDYITTSKSGLLINNTDSLLINSADKFLIN